MNSLKRFLIIAFIVLILNIIWEFSHHFLYIDLSGIAKYQHLIIASFTDMLLILGIFFTISLKNRTFNWIKRPRKFDYLVIVLLGLAVAIFLEIINLNIGRWRYTNAMPTILGIGVSPLIQLSFIGIFSLMIMNYFEK